MCDVLFPTLLPSALFQTAVMAPRRHTQNPAQGLLEADLLDADLTRCCVPTGDCLRANSADSPAYALISLDDLRDTVRVTCNNESCTVGRYMHRECFESWEQSVLTYLKSCGRARSWSERQRHQNLWTKKGYDLAFKACGCRCGRGHLKKDLDWMPPPPTSGLFGRVDEDGGLANSGKKKKRRNRGNSRPTLAISAAHPVNGYHANGNAVVQDQLLRGRAGSLSSSTGSSSPPASASSDQGASPLHGATGALKKKSSAIKIDFFSDRIRLVKIIIHDKKMHNAYPCER